MSAYHYIESGLPNVYIHGLEPMIDHEGDEVIEIPFIAALHAEIVRGIVVHNGTMSGLELRFVRSELGMTQAELAKILGVQQLTVGRWERSENEMDKPAEMVVRKLAIEQLLKPFDTSMKELALSVGNEDHLENGFHIHVDGDKYTLDAA